ncbi:hypothetical protein K8P10_001588 [Leucobacter sp. Psy1]|nr:hypothetical protein K8P10_001588 [Leucobacter sp. Psy1]
MLACSRAFTFRSVSTLGSIDTPNRTERSLNIERNVNGRGLSRAAREWPRTERNVNDRGLHPGRSGHEERGVCGADPETPRGTSAVTVTGAAVPVKRSTSTRAV